MLTPRITLGCDMARYTFNLRTTMNRFFIYRNPRKAARYMCDKHVVKMPLEEAQQLCTAHRWLDGDGVADDKGLYKSAHLNHPASVWVRSSYDNYMWAFMHFEALLEEKLRRYPNNPPHKSGELLDYLYVPPVNINRFVGFTTPPSVCLTSTSTATMSLHIVTTIDKPRSISQLGNHPQHHRNGGKEINHGPN